MTSSITPPSSSVPLHSIAPYNARIKTSGRSPEADTIRLNREFAGLLQRMWETMEIEQASRVATLKELVEVTKNLKHIDVSAAEPLGSSLYDVEITLDFRSPANAGREGTQTMSLWQLMRTYDLCKEGDARPATHEELKNLIEHVDNRSTGISTIAQTKAIELKRIVNSRDQAMLMDGNLISQLAKTLMTIISRM
jgi:hypothetical protein